MSSVGPNEAACFGPRTKLSKACNSPPDQNRLPETVLGPFQDRTKSAVTGPAAKTFCKKLASLLAEKHDQL